MRRPRPSKFSRSACRRTWQAEDRREIVPAITSTILPVITRTCERCIYCGADKELTVDHVPPKLLLTRPYPENLITVPACFPCNQSFQKDDEYMRTMLSIDVRASKNTAAQSNLPAVLRSLQRPDARSFGEYLA